MKKFLLLLSISVICSCQYDDMWIKEEFADLEERIQALEELCDVLNQDITSMTQLIEAIENSEFVTDIRTIRSVDDRTGFEITFSSGKKIIIYDGIDGQDGHDGHTPIISVRQDTDGEWYWTIDGEWMLDGNGEKVSTVGRKDLAPKLKIEDMFWYISYDNGGSWTRIGKAVGEEGTSYFKEVTYDDDNVYLTLTDGNTITVPKVSQFALDLGISKDIPCIPGQTLTIPYTLRGAGKKAEILTISEGEWYAEVVSTSATDGNIVIHVPEDINKGQVVVMASDQSKTIVRTLSFAAGVFVSKDSFLLPDEGGKFTINISTNYVYDIMTDVSWIRHAETKAVREEDVTFTYDALPEGTVSRSATITFKDRFSGFAKTIEMNQGSFVILDKTSINMIIDEEEQLTATVLLPEKDLIWTSSNSNIAWVSQDGRVVAVSKGEAVISAMTPDYTYFATCVVKVADISEYIYLQQNGASNAGYSNGYVQPDTKLSWRFYNNSLYEVVVKYLQLIDYYGYGGNKMTVNKTVPAGSNTGWTITLGTAIKAPKCKIVYEYRGKEYSDICGHMFN